MVITVLGGLLVPYDAVVDHMVCKHFGINRVNQFCKYKEKLVMLQSIGIIRSNSAARYHDTYRFWQYHPCTIPPAVMAITIAHN